MLEPTVVRLAQSQAQAQGQGNPPKRARRQFGGVNDSYDFKLEKKITSRSTQYLNRIVVIGAIKTIKANAVRADTIYKMQIHLLRNIEEIL